MTYGARELARVRNPVLLISAVTWVLLFAQPRAVYMFVDCPVVGSPQMPFSSAFQGVLETSGPAALAVGWALMLIAMMSPVLIPSLSHIRLCSLRRRCTRSIVLFLIGYAAIWMALGAVLLFTALAFKSVASQSYMPPAATAAIALVWQISPIKQRCLNRCHRHTELAAFGAAADSDAFRFGTTHGVWCAGSCWALMLIPLLLPRGHVVAMAAVALLIFGERLERPSAPCWRWRGLGRALRIIFAQLRLRFMAGWIGSYRTAD